MTNELRSPFFILGFSFFVMWLSVRVGVLLRKRHHEIDKEVCQDLQRIMASTLTLLGLLIGFSFSVAISRYDQRKNYEFPGMGGGIDLSKAGVWAWTVKSDTPTPL
jgi:hypothetical protein